MLTIATWIYVATFVYIGVQPHRMFVKCWKLCYATNDVIGFWLKQWWQFSVRYWGLSSVNFIFLYFSSLKIKTPCFQPILFPTISNNINLQKGQLRDGNCTSNPRLQVLYKITALYQTISKFIPRFLIATHTFQLHSSFYFSLCTVCCPDQIVSLFSYFPIYFMCSFTERVLFYLFQHQGKLRLKLPSRFSAPTLIFIDRKTEGQSHETTCPKKHN